MTWKGLILMTAENSLPLVDHLFRHLQWKADWISHPFSVEALWRLMTGIKSIAMSYFSYLSFFEYKNWPWGIILSHQPIISPVHYRHLTVIIVTRLQLFFIWKVVFHFYKLSFSFFLLLMWQNIIFVDWLSVSFIHYLANLCLAEPLSHQACPRAGPVIRF